jgi:hypothetical protein
LRQSLKHKLHPNDSIIEICPDASVTYTKIRTSMNGEGRRDGYKHSKRLNIYLR